MQGHIELRENELNGPLKSIYEMIAVGGGSNVKIYGDQNTHGIIFTDTSGGECQVILHHKSGQFSFIFPPKNPNTPKQINTNLTLDVLELNISTALPKYNIARLLQLFRDRTQAMEKSTSMTFDPSRPYNHINGYTVDHIRSHIKSVGGSISNIYHQENGVGISYQIPSLGDCTIFINTTGYQVRIPGQIVLIGIDLNALSFTSRTRGREYRITDSGRTIPELAY